MDESQAETLGTKMRDAYTDIASETTAVAENTGKRASRRLRKARTFAKPTPRQAAAKTGAAGDSFVSQHPMGALLIATGVGYVLSRLMHR